MKLVSLSFLRLFFFLEKYDPKYDKYKEGHTYTCHNQNPEKKILKIRS